MKLKLYTIITIIIVFLLEIILFIKLSNKMIPIIEGYVKEIEDKIMITNDI